MHRQGRTERDSLFWRASLTPVQAEVSGSISGPFSPPRVRLASHSCADLMRWSRESPAKPQDPSTCQSISYVTVPGPPAAPGKSLTG